MGRYHMSIYHSHTASITVVQTLTHISVKISFLSDFQDMYILSRAIVNYLQLETIPIFDQHDEF